MSRVLITSDWHLDHYTCIKWRKGFSTYKEMEEMLVERYLNTVRKRDTVIFLGDVAMSDAGLILLQTLPGTKVLVLGNHDTERKATLAEMQRTFTKIHSMLNYKDAWLTHAPIHPAELRNKYNIHGHVHTESIKDGRYFNACVENTHYRPIEYQEILKRLRRTSGETINTDRP